MLKKLFLDLNNFKSNLGSVERGDSIELNIKLLDSEDYSRSKFRVLGTKADGKYVEQIEGINLEEKDLKVILEDQFVNCEGIVKLELNVVSVETEITTKEFYFFVSNTMNASIIDSADSLPTLEKVSKYVDDAVDNLEALKGASEDITIINSEFKENEIKRKANEMLREKNEKARLQSEDIRITGEEERKTNELERIQAENDRKVSESNRKLAENTRKTNEAARVEAELNRQSLFEENEEIRNSNENLRIASEKERIKFNSEAKTDELNRKEAEKNRVLAEEERKSSEESRVAAEAIRQNTYTDFNESEEERKNNEIKREEAEALRVEAETRRDNLFSEKEEERNTSFIESEKVRNAAFNKAQDSRNTVFEESETVREEAFKISEKARNDAEELRVTAESERVKSEKLRVDSEKARVLAEEERNTTFTQKEEERNNTFTQNETNRNDTFTQSEEERKTTFEEAENDRKVAESKRVKVESSRVEAEKLRVSAETRRVEAENLRVTAEEERVAAETKREEGFNKFEGKINANTEELKNARSATTGEKFNTLDERIDCEVDRLNKKIEVSFLHQEDKESHMVENTVKGMTTDIVVKGRTLQNLWNGKIGNNIANKIKGETTYTIIITNCSKNTSQLNGKWVGSSSPEDFLIKPKGNQETYYIVRRVSPVNANNLSFYFVEGGEDTQLKILILEDDWLNKPIPQYFEDIKAFGQQEGKIVELSHGKNIYNWEDLYIYKPEEKWRVIEVPTFNTPEFELGKTYKVSYKTTEDVMLKIILTYQNGEDAYSSSESPLVISKDKGKVTKLRFYIEEADYSTNKKFIITNIQIEEGSKSTFEPYKEDRKEIQLSKYGFNEGLRGLNNKVYDELNSIKDVAVKRIDKNILDGDNEDWIVWANSTGDTVNAYVYFNRMTPNLKDIVKPNSICINDRLPSNQGGYLSVKEGFKITSEYFALSIHKSKLGVENVNDSNNATLLKNWLKQNPITVYYELAQPVETPLTDPINVKTFNERTYVSFKNAISGTSSFKAPVNAAATISRLNRENRALEEENKNLRQDFESTTLTLTDSDLELVKQNVDMDFRLMEVEFALDIPQAILSSNINFKK